MSARLLPAVLLTAGLLVAAPVARTAAAEPAASTYTSVSPVRVLDTRTGGPVGPGATVTLDLSSRVPDTATAVVLNVTGVTPTASTFVTVHPAGATRPTASSLNLAPGDTRPNQVTVTLGANRAVSLYNFAGNTHLVADLAGYYGTAAGTRFTASVADRALDSRESGGPIGPGGTRELDLTGRVPDSATAVTFNLTATNATASTFVTAWPAGSARPAASNLNLPAGDTRANLVTVPIGTDRSVSLYNNAGSVDLIADVTGFYAPDFGAVFQPRNPARVLDTRTGAPVGPRGTVRLDLAGTTPLTTTGVLLNLTAVGATEPTFVSAWPDFPARGVFSNINLSAGQTVPNAAMVAFAESRTIQLYNHNGSVHLVADLAGYFAVPDTPCTTDCASSWGANSSRELGTGEAVDTVPTPSRVRLAGVRAVAPHANGAYALRTDGTVWAWGDNGTGELGLGLRSAWHTAVAAPLPGLTDVTAIAAGANNGYALRGDGTVWAWGANWNGRLGNGAVSNDPSPPVQVTGLTGVVAIGAGLDAGYAVRADGTLWAWGGNWNGQLGNGTTGNSPTPVQILTGVTAVAGGDGATYALRTDGTVWAWGRGEAGQLGNGTFDEISRVPVQVSGLTGVTSVAAGEANGYAVRDDGSVWAWGWAANGRLGTGVDCPVTDLTCEVAVPARVADLSGATQVAAFESGGYALLSDGTVRSWGDNHNAGVGNESVTGYTTVPVRVTGLSGVRAIAGRDDAGYALVP